MIVKAAEQGLAQDDRDSIVARYTTRFQQYGIDIRTLSPGSEAKHRIQHTVHSSVGELLGTTILDVGCGLAHYYAFLKERGLQVRYIGYDIVPVFIEINRERYPEAEFVLRDVSCDGIAHTPDYVTMCQVFNNRYAGVDNEDVRA